MPRRWFAAAESTAARAGLSSAGFATVEVWRSDDGLVWSIAATTGLDGPGDVVTGASHGGRLFAAGSLRKMSGNIGEKEDRPGRNPTPRALS